jgi:hypothetical protein
LFRRGRQFISNAAFNNFFVAPGKIYLAGQAGLGAIALGGGAVAAGYRAVVYSPAFVSVATLIGMMGCELCPAGFGGNGGVKGFIEDEEESAYVAKLSGFDLRAHLDSLLRRKVGIGFYETAPPGMLTPLQNELHSGAENSVFEIAKATRNIETIKMGISSSTVNGKNAVEWGAYRIFHEHMLRGYAQRLARLPDPTVQ